MYIMTLMFFYDSCAEGVIYQACTNKKRRGEQKEQNMKEVNITGGHKIWRL
jgi:hypothetical protein